MNIIYVGLDVSKRKIDCALKLGDTYKMKVISNDEIGYLELFKFLNNNHINMDILSNNDSSSSLHFCCEATNVYWEGLAKFLLEQNCKISVVNPMQIKNYSKVVIQRTKNDKADARLIADYCEKHQPHSWVKPSAEIHQLESYLKHLARQKCIRTQVSNNELVSSQSVSDFSHALMDFIDGQIIELERLIRKLIKDHPDLKKKYDLLKTIPSVGELTASTLLTLLYDASKFKTASHAVSIGLSPREHQSGSSVKRRSGISKIGDSGIRKTLYMPAMVAFSRMAVFKPFVERMKKRGKPVKVIIVALMRKLIIVAHAILKSGVPFCAKRFLGA